jgi:hypothetical protein
MPVADMTRQNRKGRDSMHKHALLLAAGVTLIALSFGAVACSDDDKDGDSPTATAEMVDETPMADETPGAGAAIDVRLLEFTVAADPTSASAGEVTFNAANIGQDPHELVVIRTDLAPEALPTSEDGSVDEAGEGIEVIGEIEEFAAGGEESATFTLEAGSYVLICNVVEEEDDGTVESHYAEGMHTAFIVN